FGPVNNTVFQTYMQNIQLKTDAGEYILGWTAELFENTSPNFSNVTFNVTDGKLIITPKTGVVVTITENSSELVYNTEEQSVEGYTYSINDELNIYSEEDFSFSGNAVAAGTTVGTYPMELSAADFSNTNSNFADVTFNIVDGALTITKAPVAPNKPEAAIETRYINTQLVALPADWAWSEYAALAMGNNTATANYTGVDKGNYVIESVEVTIIRGECLHNEGNEVLYTLEPTCTHKGYTGNLSCKLCGEIYEMGDSIPALGHDFVETVIAPTCTADGYTEHLCNRCQHIEYSDTVAANGHKADSVVFENMVAATCTVAGSYDSVVYCSVCRVELSRDVVDVPAAGHKADSVVIENIVRPTLEAAGSYDSVIYCSVCKTEISRKKIDILASAVAVSKLPNKVEYKQGEALDVKGGKLTATYSDESTAEFEMLAGWVSGFDSEKVGKQTLTVKFETVSSTLTTTFDVTVSAKDDNTAIDEDVAEISIYAYSNIIVVEAADAITGEIAVFDVNGRMVRKTLAAGTRTEIQMQRQGLYIVRVGNQAKRVVIK
ncbi:MAG: bacterial Ig-like domain-containing protein, partial [Salinivirgaceae bacterium]|nr:bacterial Ig-like domain-containing protein [Salinivirgaceae bacterium]